MSTGAPKAVAVGGPLDGCILRQATASTDHFDVTMAESRHRYVKSEAADGGEHTLYPYVGRVG